MSVPEGRRVASNTTSQFLLYRHTLSFPSQDKFGVVC